MGCLTREQNMVEIQTSLKGFELRRPGGIYKYARLHPHPFILHPPLLWEGYVSLERDSSAVFTGRGGEGGGLHVSITLLNLRDPPGSHLPMIPV